MGRSGRLGILDWGIGGIGIYKLIRRRSPNASVTYFSDTGVAPYGKMSRGELVERLDRVIRFFKAEAVDRLLIGCNAASTAIPFLDRRGLLIVGVIETAVGMAVRSRPERLGLIGGRRTVLSGVYRNAVASEGLPVAQRVAQPLSALIESGDTSSEVLRGEARRITHPLRNCSHILLACTHYPAITPVLREFVSPETVFLDPAVEIAESCLLAGLDAGGVRFLTSGDPEAMRRAAGAAFGVTIEQAERVDISLLR